MARPALDGKAHRIQSLNSGESASETPWNNKNGDRGCRAQRQPRPFAKESGECATTHDESASLAPIEHQALHAAPSGNPNSARLAGSISAAVAGELWREVATRPDPARLNKVLARMIHELAHPAVPRPADRNEIDHRQVLHELAQPHASRVRTHRHAKLRRKQQDGQILIHPSHAARVDSGRTKSPSPEAAA
jgi:hypothetical protein